MIILGIDPGIATLGFGVIEKDARGNCRALDYGAVTTPKDLPLPKRLQLLEDGIQKILQKYNPDEVAMEELFFSKNVTTGIAVAQARGVALLTCAKHTEKLFEYTPMQIKQAVTGYGNAEKRQMQEVTAAHLKLASIPKPDDAADALAVALCQAFTSRFSSMFSVGNMTRQKGQNTLPATRYEELLRAEEKKSKSKKTSMSKVSQARLEQATGLSGITGVGRASTLPCPPKTKK